MYDGDVHVIDPLVDPRWLEFIGRHPLASVFHSREWLQALIWTYGYKPLAVITGKEELTNGIVLCIVRSRFTGNRIVSVPFADHCAPLVGSQANLECLIGYLQSLCDDRRYGYVEIRGTLGAQIAAFRCERTFCMHALDLRPSIGEIFDRLHKSCIQRKIRHAETIGLKCHHGSSESIVREFYELHVRTRARHGVPPQPFVWFLNLLRCFGGRLAVWVITKEARPIAAVLTLRHKRTLVYKYAASDASVHHFGGPVLAIWNAIQAAKANEMETLDFGRSDREDTGLISFKERWGAQRYPLPYWRYPASAGTGMHGIDSRTLARVLTHMPLSLLKVTGNLLYRHLA